MGKIRIAMADDHSMVREATCRALDQYPDFEIVGQAADGQQALELVKGVQPHVLLIDIRMPVLDGIEVLRRMKGLSPGTKALVLSAYDDEEYVLESVKAGASGYLLKTVDLNELAQSIRTVHFGQTVFHPSIAAKIVSVHEQRQPGGQLERLSHREREILDLAAGGLDNDTIAVRLELSVRTVEGHLSRIYTKLGVASRAQAVKAVSFDGSSPSNPAHR
ncbi:MAG: hypothetical protein A2147_11440 [Chloroflexi bacterium RBG_16_57_8]|nr:MAG: hypothetical protein A2147_11440 [Chloroflexi bacterium RBG_16_57_8]